MPLTLVALGGDAPKRKEPTLAELLRAYAMKHFEPGPHMALAEFHHDKANHLPAYHILETARRTRFEGKVFDAAFGATFRGRKPFDDGMEAENWVGLLLFRVRENEEESLHYYLNVYFVDPHFYDTEHAEARIRKMNYTVAAAIVEKAEMDGQPVASLTGHANPVVASLALGKAAKSWTPSTRTLVLDALGHDDPTIRMQAVGILMENTDDVLDKKIHELLGGGDRRMRGLACYLAAHVWKEKGVEGVRPMLGDPAPLVRHDAVSALWRDGGEKGKQLVREHRPREKSAWLVQMIDSFDEKAP